jgi:putative N6-adenine-specific DNA methylase
MGCRVADRILLECACFEARDFDALFEGTRSVVWEDYIPRGMGLVVAKVRANRSVLMAETSIQAIVHKAAAERLCEKWGVNRLPNNTSEAELRVYIEKDTVFLLLDLSGEPLFKRGYRTAGGPAPLRETTAAALILLSGWKRKYPLYDPFCGSGTIALEAAMYAWDMAPCLQRNFAIERLTLKDSKIEAQIRKEFISRIDFSRQIRICGSDVDKQTVELAQANMHRTMQLAQGKIKDKLDINRLDIEILHPPFFKAVPMEETRSPYILDDKEQGFIITNPPYGKRLGDKETSEGIYRDMAGMAQRFPGWRLVLISDHPGFESFFGKKADSCREITNGAIQSYMYQYEKL